MSLKDEIIAYKNNTDLKDRYVAYVTDESIPLDDRWDMFREAPTDFKESQNWVVHFKSESLLPGGEIAWYDDFYAERHETIYMVDFIVDRLPEHLAEALEVEDNDPQILEIVNAFKAEVLAKNLDSFDYDW